ncbi:MAG: hypothetical protein ABR552_07900 [Actinomycetota bacterium]
MGRNDREFRSWVGDNAVRDDIDVVREWIVWGVGTAPPSEIEEARAANDVATMIAKGHDPEWFDTDAGYRWAILVRGVESDIDDLSHSHGGIWGYAAYLVEGKNDEVPARYMRGTLRSDVGPRRKVDQPGSE